jgi:hypothetical protein
VVAVCRLGCERPSSRGGCRRWNGVARGSSAPLDSVAPPDARTPARTLARYCQPLEIGVRVRPGAIDSSEPNRISRQICGRPAGRRLVLAECPGRQVLFVSQRGGGSGSSCCGLLMVAPIMIESALGSALVVNEIPQTTASRSIVYELGPSTVARIRWAIQDEMDSTGRGRWRMHNTSSACRQPASTATTATANRRRTLMTTIWASPQNSTGGKITCCLLTFNFAHRSCPHTCRTMRCKIASATMTNLIRQPTQRWPCSRSQTRPSGAMRPTSASVRRVIQWRPICAVLTMKVVWQPVWRGKYFAVHTVVCLSFHLRRDDTPYEAEDCD